MLPAGIRLITHVQNNHDFPTNQYTFYVFSAEGKARRRCLKTNLKQMLILNENVSSKPYSPSWEGEKETMHNTS